jgi:hypothetical protein
MDYTEQELVEHYDTLVDMGFLMYLHNENVRLSEEMFIECFIRGEPIDMIRRRYNGTLLECSGVVIGRF